MKIWTSRETISSVSCAISQAWPDPNQLQKIQDLCLNAETILIGGHGVWWSKKKKIRESWRRIKYTIFNIPYHQKLWEKG